MSKILVWGHKRALFALDDLHKVNYMLSDRDGSVHTTDLLSSQKIYILIKIINPFHYVFGISRSCI
jgi:hypothetical protein